MTKYRVLVRDSSDSYAGNALTFETAEGARQWGSNLADRWTALRSFAVVKVDLAPDNSSYFSVSLVRREALMIEECW